MRSVSIGWLVVIGFVSLGAAPAGAQVIGGQRPECVKSVGEKRVVEHSGSLDGFMGTIERHVDHGVSFVVLTHFEKADVGALIDIVESDFLPE